jgi:hypothetical protein
MMLFNTSPPFALAAEFLNVGSHAGAVCTPADKANTGIRTADTAGSIFRQRQGMHCKGSVFSNSCFFFWCYIILHGLAPFSENKKGATFFVRQRLLILLFSCITDSNLLQ